MHEARRRWLWINAIGGVAVLGSYVHGVVTNPMTRGDVWGGVPAALQPVYTVNMLLAAAGYFAFSYFVFFRVDPERTSVLGRFGFDAWNVLYALILIPSALWMPLTFAMLDAPGAGLWWSIRGVLALVGIGSLGLLVSLVAADDHGSRVARVAAIAGSFFFTLQTAVLDALVWPAYYPWPS